MKTSDCEQVFQPYDEVDEIDYRFSKLPVRERRKIFQNDNEPPKIRQAGAVSKLQATRSGAQSDFGRLSPPIRRQGFQINRIIQRPASTYDGHLVSSCTFEIGRCNPQSSKLQSLRKSNQLQQSVQYSRPNETSTSYAVSRRPVAPKFTSSSVKPIKLGTFISPRPTQRPMLLKAYNSDVATHSQLHPGLSSTWGGTPSVYPAYSAYKMRPGDTASQRQSAGSGRTGQKAAVLLSSATGVAPIARKALLPVAVGPPPSGGTQPSSEGALVHKRIYQRVPSPPDLALGVSEF